MFNTVQLMGGFGNQLFQIASIWGYSKKNNNIFIIDTQFITQSCFKHTNNLYINIYNKFIINKQIQWNNVFNEPPKTCYLDLPQANINKNTIFVGYFQSPKYFNHISGEILNWLLPHPSDILLQYPDLSNTAFIHIRMGDYIDIPLHNVDLYNYYKKAIEQLPSNTKLIAITNNEEQARQFYPDIISKTQGFLQENDPLQTIRIMACADHGIICANSSFSWWGAYLNYLRANTKSFAPSKWFNDNTYNWSDMFFDGLQKIDV